MFGIASNARNFQVSTCTAEQLDKALRSPVVAKACATIEDALEQCRRGEMDRKEFDAIKSRCKPQLPVLTPHAIFTHNRRKAEQAIPSGFSMYDIDHISNPRGRWSEIASRANELGICLAHITPSTEGLRLIFVMPQGMSLEQAQLWMSQQLGDATYDAACKDYARCSFLVPEDYVLYRNDSLLFADVETIRQKSVSMTQIAVPTFTQSVAAAPQQVVATAQIAAAPSAVQTAVSATLQGNTTTNRFAQTATTQYPATYKDIPYPLIVEKLEEQLGGKPEQGARNSFLFSIACSLRFICNNDERWLQQILPHYGLEEAEWRGTIHSATTRPLARTMEGTLVRALKVCGVESDLMAANVQNSDSNEADSHALTPPAMPEKLPPLIELLTSQTPEVYKAAVAHAVFPSLATHLYNTRFRYIDNVEHEATLMCLLMAGTGAGKSCVDEPINRIMADIRKRDDANLARERAWKEEINRKGANKDKRERPKGLVVQEIDADITNPAFVMRTAEAEGHFLYSKLNEVDQFDALKGSGKGGQQFQLMCLSFDPNNRYGQTRVGSQSVTEKVTVRYNWNASTTIAKGQSYFRNVLINGPISRINFCTIPEREIGAPMPIYGTYTEAFDQQLQPYIERLCNIRGLIACPEAEALAQQLLQESMDVATKTHSRTYENLSFRANVIAYLKAMVLYVAHGGWDESFNDFIRWSKEYDLYCKMAFFGDLIEEAESATQKTNRHGPANLLNSLPNEFDLQALTSLLQSRGKKMSASSIASMWQSRGYIVRIDKANKIFQKIQ